MTTPADVTMVRNAIHNPADARHFMSITPAGNRRRVTVGDRVIADSENAVVVKEVAFDIYDPVLYFPRDDVDMASLTVTDKTTHCPLKGDTEYFDLVADDGPVADIAWSYVELVTECDELLHLVAFDSAQVTHTSD